jgi:hypothetical protein
MKTAEEKEIYELIEVRKKAIRHLNVDRWLPEDTVWVAKQFAEQYHEERTCKWDFDEEHWFYDWDFDEEHWFYDWVFDEEHWFYDWVFDENKHNYCPFCGGRIIITNKE